MKSHKAIDESTQTQASETVPKCQAKQRSYRFWQFYTHTCLVVVFCKSSGRLHMFIPHSSSSQKQGVYGREKNKGNFIQIFQNGETISQVTL